VAASIDENKKLPAVCGIICGQASKSGESIFG
jgi:hypothetical protein